MGTQHRISDAELRSLLQDKQWDLAFTRLSEDHASEVACYVKKHSRVKLGPDDLATVALDAIATLYEKVSQGNSLPDHPVQYVKAVALYMAADIGRDRCKSDPLLDPTSIPSPARGDTPGHRLTQNEFLAALKDSLETLPKQQRLVATEYLRFVRDCGFPPTFEELAEIVSDELGSRISVPAVKSAWQEAKTKLRAKLVRHGYGEFLR